MRIRREDFDAIVAHARDDAPNECCGLVAARDDEVTGVHRVTNVFASPLRFELEPIEQYKLTEQIEQRGDRMAGSYHSHTKSEAYPSQTDVNQWDPWPELVHLICSIAAEKPVVRAFEIRDKQVHEVELVVEDG
ncbi:MAG: Mov34/MPN/PAD-1 family protein [Solirubrobacterales bacterium]